MTTNSYWERALAICFLTISAAILIERREPEGIGLPERFELTDALMLTEKLA